MTEIMAHRGSRINRPENTLAAFEEAVRVGADGIELDVHLSKDGQVVVIHDETLDRTTDGAGFVHEWTLADLQQLDAGSWFDPAFADQKIPALAEVLDLLEALGFQGRLNIELKRGKNRGMEKKIHFLLEQKQLSFEVLFSSFSLRALWRLHRLMPGARSPTWLKRVRPYSCWGNSCPGFPACISVRNPISRGRFPQPKKSGSGLSIMKRA